MLLDNKRVGLILRVFSPKPELVQKNVDQVVATIDAAMKIEINGRRVFSRVDVLVSADARYGDTDCGDTLRALENFFDSGDAGESRGHFRRDVHIAEVQNGDIFCGMLNYGVAHQMRDRVDYSMILSIGVRDYLTEENMQTMLEALEKGAKVTGLAITELAPSILDGRIANTAAIWDNVSLMTVGGFDLRAAKPLKDDRLADYVRGWSVEKGEVFYNAAGVEEIFPLVRMVKLFGHCIAPVLPQTRARWEVSNDPDVKRREQAKLGTKYERQMRWLVAEDVDFSFLKGGVMPEYKNQK